MKIRNKNENNRYIKYLESAIDEAQQSIDSITYSTYPEINRRTIKKIKEAIELMEDAMEACIFKP